MALYGLEADVLVNKMLLKQGVVSEPLFCRINALKSVSFESEKRCVVSPGCFVLLYVGFVLMFYVPVNNAPVMSGVFLSSWVEPALSRSKSGHWFSSKIECREAG